jgi:hypothetical protein
MTELEIVQAIRAKYPRNNPGGWPLGEDAPWALIEVAQRFDAQVYRKDSGEHCFIPKGVLAAYPDGVFVNRAIIGRGALGNRWYKVFGDGEGEAPAIWRLGETPADGEYIDVSAVVLPGHEAPPLVPVPAPAPDGDLKARVEALEAWKARVQA